MKKETAFSTRDNLLATASKLFAQKGFKATSMQEIADSAGVNKALLFYYFDSKDNLYYSILKKSLNNFITALKNAASSSSDVVEQLKQVMLVIPAQMEKEKYLTRILMRELGEMGKILKEHIQLFSTCLTPIEEIIKKGIHQNIFRPLDPHLTAISLISIMKNLSLRKMLFGEPSIKEIFQHTSQLILNGLLISANPE